jgi:hypothetical protein
MRLGVPGTRSRRLLGFGAVFLVVAALPAAAAAIEVEAFDASEEAGILETSRTWSANVHDFDGDGWEDVLISRHYQGPARLYHNTQAGGFEEVQEGAFPDRDRHDCAWADVDQDGDADVYCAIGAHRGTGADPKELWLQQPDGTFVDRAQDYGIDDPLARGRYATFIDVNRDIYPDLYVASTFPRPDGLPSRNKLFINRRGDQFRNGREYGLNRELGGESVQAVDYNSDGWEDLLVCGKREELHLFRNLKGEGFKDVGRKVGAGGSCQSAQLMRLDGDMRPDLVRVADDHMVVKLQRSGDFRSVYARPLRFGQSLAAGDIDADLDLDLYVLQSGPKEDAEAPDERDLMLVNAGDGREFSRIKIPQTREGRGDAVSAIDYDRNGLADFFVLNGHSNNKGPIRLVAFRPAPAVP